MAKQKMHLLADILIQVSSPTYSDEMTEKIGDLLESATREFVAIVKRKIWELDIPVEEMEAMEVDCR